MAHISFFTNVKSSQIKETETHFMIEGVPVTVDDAVMNGLLYSAEHNRAGMPTIRDRVITLGHPRTANGSGADAYAGESLQKFYSGGHIESVYADNGVWRVNISISKALLRAQDEAQNSNFYDRLANKEPIGVSTGLYTEVDATPGTNAKGDEYTGIATKQQYNHLAMLDANEPPAGGQDTFMRFNGKAEQDAVINLVDYMPDSIPQDSDDDKIEPEKDEVQSFITKFLAMLGIAGMLKTNQTEVDAMPDIKKMMQALKDNGTYKDGMSDDDVKAAYEKMTAKSNAQEPQGIAQEQLADLIKQAVNAAVEPLNAQIGELKSQLNAKDEAEKQTLVDAVNALELGMAEDDVKNLSTNSLQALLDKHNQTLSVNGAYRPTKPAATAYDDIAG